jgi:hypothetical protein
MFSLQPLRHISTLPNSNQFADIPKALLRAISGSRMTFLILGCRRGPSIRTLLISFGQKHLLTHFVNARRSDPAGVYDVVLRRAC